MRIIPLTAVSALALGAAACMPHPDYAARTALDCPVREGELVRTSMAADGKTCSYRASEGVDVTLQLTPVNGDPTATLSAVEASLVRSKTGEAQAKPPETPAPAAQQGAAAPDDAAKAAQEASEDAAKSAGARSDEWNAGAKRGVLIDKDGKMVVVGDGDHARINLPGVHIEADDRNAKVDIAGVRIDANNDNATVHVVRDVRLQGEAFSREKRGLRATFIAKRDDLPDGYRFVGYEASGPKTGPLTIAVVRSRSEIDDGNRLYHDIQRLVRRNGGA